MAKGPDVRPLIGNTIAMLLVGLILTAMAGSPALAAQAYTISGSVTNFATQTPLKDVLVTAKDASSSTAGFILSDASGHYTISLSSTGIYTVLAGKSGYDDASPPDRPVDITDVSPNAIVNLSMMPQMDSLSLAAGWNFISFPQLPSSSASIETVLNDASPSVRIVWGYDNVNKVWLKYSPNLSLRTPNSLDKVEYGKGYWIYTDTPATISLLSWSPPDSSPISLLEGWNLIGYHGPDNLALSTATQGIFGKWSILWNWDNGQWYGKHATTTSLPSPIQPLASFYRGKAYWIRAKEKTDWVQSMYTNTISQMVPYIEKQLADSGVTGGVSIALVDDQQVVWAKSFGYADAGTRTLATPDTTYRIASVTKTFTAAMMMQLYEQGLLDVDDPLTRFIPAFSIKAPLGFPAGGPITIRSILTHHSGIPGDIDNGVFTVAPDPGFNAKLVAYLQGEYLAYPAGFIWAYSNSGISLLATVIENASGKGLQAYSDALFQTLGMDRSSVSMDSPKVSANMAQGYETGQLAPRFYNNGGTTGAIISTVQDVAKFIKMMNAGGVGERGRVLKADTIETMLTPQNSGIPLDFDTRIGFIWLLNDANLAYAGRLCYHEGANTGFRSYLGILRDHKLGVVVLANDGKVSYDDIAKQTLKLALQEKAGLAPPSPFVPVYSPPAVWDQARLDALQGIYVFSEQVYTSPVPYITVRSLAGALEWTNPDDGTTVHIVPKANGWLSAPDSQAMEYEFSEVSGEKVIIAHHNGKTALEASYYSPPAIPPAWTARIGTYQATNWNSAIPTGPKNLIIQNGLLGFGAYVLVPVSDNLAYVSGLSRTGGSSVQVHSIAPDGHEEIQLLGVRYRKN